MALIGHIIYLPRFHLPASVTTIFIQCLEDITRTHSPPLFLPTYVPLLPLTPYRSFPISLPSVSLSLSNTAGLGTATNKSDVSSSGEHQQQPEVPPPASAPVDADEIKASQASHLVNRHMVLPFIPPKFANADSNTLLKPSEYLKSICKTTSKNSLSKARSVIFPVTYNGVYFRLFRSPLRASCFEKQRRLYLVVWVIKYISKLRFEYSTYSVLLDNVYAASFYAWVK